MPHCISLPVGDRLLRLAEHFELVWASGWEDKANFYLPQLLGLPELPHISFDVAARSGGAHWKLAAMEDLAGERSIAWIDDNFDESCYEWAERRGGADAARPDRAPSRARGGPRRGAERLGRFRWAEAGSLH